MSPTDVLRERVDFCSLLFESTGVPLHGVTGDGEVAFSCSDVDGPADSVVCSDELRSGMWKAVSAKDDGILIHITEEKALVGVVACKEADGCILVGPIPHAIFSDSSIGPLAARMSVADVDAFSNDFRYNLPRMGIRAFASLCGLVYYQEWGIRLRIDSIVFGVSMERDEDYTYPSYQTSSYLQTGNDRVQGIPAGKSEVLLSYIMRGDVKATQRYLDDMSNGLEEYSPYSSEWVARYMPENQKGVSGVYLARIMFIAAASHIAEMLAGKGFSAERAWLLWYYYVDQAMGIDSVYGINKLSKKMVIDFTERCTPSLHDASYQVQQAMSYIRQHLGDGITPEMVARACRYNYRYLSDQFKREVGLSISKYIQQERINAAKDMLEYSDQTIAGISSSLGFSSQSYFTSVFKRFTGYTPVRFRERFGRMDRGNK